MGFVPGDHDAAMLAALPVVVLAERDDSDAFLRAVGEHVGDADRATRLVSGLVSLVQFWMGQPALEGGERITVLNDQLVWLAQDAG